MNRYNFKTIENKWQKFWEQNKSFQTKTDKKKKKILLFRDVSLPIWKDPYGSCKKLYNWRCFGSI